MNNWLIENWQFVLQISSYLHGMVGREYMLSAVVGWLCYKDLISIVLITKLLISLFCEIGENVL